MILGTVTTVVVTALLGHWVDCGVIFGVVVVNALIGFIQESKAEKALDSIRSLLSLRAFVLRAGQRRQIPAEELVPGDIVLLQAGDKVPADLRLLQVKDLRVDEAILTGESQPVGKGTDAVATGAAMGDRFGMAYSGTVVTYGRGTGVVVATGRSTEIGRISQMLADVESLTTPLLARMDIFARWLTVAILVLAGGTFAPPLQILFGTAAIDAASWGRIVLVASTVFILVELEKLVYAAWQRRGPAGATGSERR